MAAKLESVCGASATTIRPRPSIARQTSRAIASTTGVPVITVRQPSAKRGCSAFTQFGFSNTVSPGRIQSANRTPETSIQAATARATAAASS